MAGGRSLVALLLLASSAKVLGKTYIVNSPKDNGACTFNGICDLRGAWNTVEDGDEIVLSTNSSLKTPLGQPDNAAGILLIGSREMPMYVTNGREETDYHREFIRWTSFNASNGLVLVDLTIFNFSSSQPGGRNVQEFGGAINLGCVPQEGGYHPAYCRNKLDTPAVTNVQLARVEFKNNYMRSSSPTVNDQYGAAVAVCCEGCGVSIRQSAFLSNIMPHYPEEVQAGGAVFTDVSMTTVVGSVFIGNGFTKIAGRGADVFTCGPMKLTDSNFSSSLTMGGSVAQSEGDLTVNNCQFTPTAEKKTGMIVLEAHSVEVLRSSFTLKSLHTTPVRAFYSRGYISMERTSFQSATGVVIELRKGAPGSYIWNKYPGEGHGNLMASELPFASCQDQLDACNPLQKCSNVLNSTSGIIGYRCS